MIKGSRPQRHWSYFGQILFRKNRNSNVHKNKYRQTLRKCLKYNVRSFEKRREFSIFPVNRKNNEEEKQSRMNFDDV